MQNNALKPEKQNEVLTSYASKISKSEAKIEWSKPADDILLQIRAFNNWPVAQAIINDQVIRIWQAIKSEYPVSNEKPGTILTVDKKGIVVACGKNSITILNLQRIGSKAMATSDFLNGHAELVAVGNYFS